MKFSKIALAIVATLGFAGSAMADFHGVKLSGGVGATSDFNFRGQSLSGDSPSMGFTAAAAHTSGAYAALDENTVNLSGVPGAAQYLSTVTAGYGTSVGDGIGLSGGVTRYQFGGAYNVGGLSFTEAFVTADWRGLGASLYRNVDSADGDPARYTKGDTYASFGYTHAIGKYTFGGDVGYYWYAKNQAAKDGVAVAVLRAGYQVDDHLSLGVAYQAAGNDASGNAQDRNEKAVVNFGYSF